MNTQNWKCPDTKWLEASGLRYKIKASFTGTTVRRAIEFASVENKAQFVAWLEENGAKRIEDAEACTLTCAVRYSRPDGFFPEGYFDNMHSSPWWID